MAVTQGFVLVFVVTLIHAQSTQALLFKDAVEQWQQLKCLFPSRCLFSEDAPDKCSDKAHLLLACKQLDVYNGTDENDMFKATLCQQFYKISISFCKLMERINATQMALNLASCLVSETIDFGNESICSFAKNESSLKFMNNKELCRRNCEDPQSPSSDVCKMSGYIIYILKNSDKCSNPKGNQANDGKPLVTKTQSATENENGPKIVPPNSSNISTENKNQLDVQLKPNDIKGSNEITSGVVHLDTDAKAISETTLTPAISLTDTSIEASRTELSTSTTVLTTPAATVPQSRNVTENSVGAGTLPSSVRSTTRAGSADDETVSSSFVIQTDPDVLPLKADAGITSTTTTSTTAAAAYLLEDNSTPEHSDDKVTVTSYFDGDKSTENDDNQSADNRDAGMNDTPVKGSPAITDNGKLEKGNNIPEKGSPAITEDGKLENGNKIPEKESPAITEDGQLEKGNNNLSGLKDKVESLIKPESGNKETTFYVADDANSPGSGHFLAYFLTAVVLCVSGYIIYHNKQKILAFIIEGRNSGRGGRQRSKDVKYSPLKSSVEEVLPSLEHPTSSKNFVY